jgi:NAD(P)-dependent dehydrogenase (short-subunit alcohol dehydrogenase family)
MPALAGKVVVVTGASSGLGEATARRCAKDGALVVLAARREDKRKAVLRAIEDAGGEAIFVRTDVTVRTEVEALIDETIRAFGRLDCAVNNAGITGPTLTALADVDRGHRTLRVVCKGGPHVTIPLAPRTARALDVYIGERAAGPIFLAAGGGRLDRYAADRTVKRLARRAGITKPISPHSLRHRFITTALDAGVPLRDVQEAASHADPRTTMRYDRARQSLYRHATYIVAAFVAGAAP